MHNYSILVCKDHIILKLVPDEDATHSDQVFDIYPKKKKAKKQRKSK